MIGYGAWSSLAHAFTMTIMSAQAVAHGMHRKDSPQDIVIFVAIGVTLLALFPAKQASPDIPPERIARQAEAGTKSFRAAGALAAKKQKRGST